MINVIGSTTTVSWTETAGEFNIYRGTRLDGSPFDYVHACMNPVGPITATSMDDPTFPGSDGLFFYLVTRVDQCRESVAGYASDSIEPRPNPYLCPDTGPDNDSDTWPDTLDNCPTTYNPLQEDTNGNGVGDACES